MAANFWTSSHYKQLLDPEEVDVLQQQDKDKGITLDDFKLIKMHMANSAVHFLSFNAYLFQFPLFFGFFSSDIWKLAQQVKVRQRVVATAVTYMRRVYTRKSMSEYDPRLVAPTCLYLAAKAEESTVQARLLVFYIRKLYSDEKYRYEIKDILEMEMKILEALNYYLVVFHPYRSLSQLLQDAGIHDINMIQLSCVYREKDITAWFEELHVDMNVVKNISMEILDFYEGYRLITEERISTAFSKLALKP
ncbi:cyclin-C1-1 isoform X3 [Ricinus communis]|uniref:cyclin-C1-1 isoform X3 n=1 Tax=Ricinus communis TaxID=3988 RepID=UPI00201B30D5|nr:cyclin-C1-1 isoform X3 [Ricinus communis]